MRGEGRKRSGRSRGRRRKNVWEEREEMEGKGMRGE